MSAIVVLSGGAVDSMNPQSVRSRMDEYIAATGLDYKILPNQRTPHIHHSRWRELIWPLRDARPLVIVGHSNGGAAAMSLARTLARPVDLLVTCDSVLTLDDVGDINQVPPNVRLNVNTYTIPTPAWFLAPFPFGRRNRGVSHILNVGLAYNLPGALAHRNTFYEIAGGYRYSRQNLLQSVTTAVLQGETPTDIIAAARASLTVLATKSAIRITVN
jgi:pimeloyl-ACP methyl ester carboxylesterase